MFRIIALCFTYLFLSNGSYAQSQFADTDKALLWEISGKGLQKPSFLFGTIHIICKEDRVWTPEMEKALSGAGKVALEIDMDDPELQRELVAGIMMKDRTLKSMYSAEQYEQLSAFAEKNDLPLAMMQNIKPFAVMSLVYPKLLACEVPFSYENDFTEKAQSKHTEVVGLESVKDQVSVFDHMDSDSMAQELLDMVVHLDSAKKDYAKLVAAYSKQDLPALFQLLLESPDYKGDLNTLLYDRNRKWIPVIEALTHKQSTFIAVGAGHLWGDKGVIALLRKKGYTVTAVRSRS